jgi:HEPN domain-containing protein
VTGDDFSSLANERLDDATALLSTERFAGAVYMCGYAVEFALKARICKYLGWDEFREDYRDLKTHNLEVLFSFTGLSGVKASFDGYWNDVIDWKPEIRYHAGMKVTRQMAEGMISSTNKLMEVLL